MTANCQGQAYPPSQISPRGVQRQLLPLAPDTCLTDAGHLPQRGWVGIQDPSERTETREQCFGNWFCIALPDAGEEQVLKYLLICQCNVTSLEQASTQSRTMANSGMLHLLVFSLRQA